jgi:tryptophanyl-tRNA synthetase
MTEAAFTPRVFSGIQPSGHLHLGNYLGALKRFAEAQNRGVETLYCMVDLHAVTVWQEPASWPGCSTASRGWAGCSG